MGVWQKEDRAMRPSVGFRSIQAPVLVFLPLSAPQGNDVQQPSFKKGEAYDQDAAWLRIKNRLEEKHFPDFGIHRL